MGFISPAAVLPFSNPTPSKTRISRVLGSPTSCESSFRGSLSPHFKISLSQMTLKAVIESLAATTSCNIPRRRSVSRCLPPSLASNVSEGIEMCSWAPASVFTYKVSQFSATVTESSINTKCNASFVCKSSRERWYLSVAEACYKVRRLRVCGAIKSTRGLSTLQTQQGTWEEPDDGSGSEYDDEGEEDEQMEDENFGFESDWEEEEKTTSAVNHVITEDKFGADIKKEVEQLLEPEERAILQRNVAPNLEKISTAKWSPLHTLALSTQISCMDKLLENGLDINFINKEGLTALHKAIIGKKEAVISHLLRKGASPHVKDKDGATPLHYAVQVGAKQTVKLLIKYKVDVNIADNEGWTPLHVAIQSRNRDIAKILLVNGADKTRRNKDGKTPLDLSLCFGKDFKSYDLAKLLKVVPANRDL